MNPNIVVVDGQALNPGDLDWSALEALGACRVYPRTPPADVVPRVQDAEIVLTNKVVFDRALLAELPKLRYIGVTATGYNVIDVQAARERDIPVTNVPTYATPAVAQIVFAHILEHAHRIGDHARAVADGAWSRSEDFCFWDFPLIELDALTLGIVGFGRIGRAVAALAHAFGMNVVVHDVAGGANDEGVTRVSLDDLFRSADVVTLHCPLTPETEQLVNTERLAMMKTSAFLINTARGPVIDEAALADALNRGVIAGAGLDVLSAEPPAPDNPLLAAKNCFITPHIAWATRAARARLMDTVVENVRAFLAGKPVNVVNSLVEGED